MDFELDDDDKLLCDNVRELGRQELAPHSAAWDEAEGWSEGLRGSLGDLGLLGLRVGENRGGTGLGVVATAAVIEELAVADAAVATMVAVHNVLGLGALLRAGRLQADAITAAARGEHFLAWCGDAGELQARGSDGAWTLHGRAPFVVGAPGARTIVALARVDDEPAAFAIEAEGLAVERVRTLGLRALPVGAASLEGVPATRLCDGATLRAIEAEAAVVLAAASVGLMGASLLVGRDYALERKQFGKPIAAFQAIKWKVADAATDLEAARLLTRRAAAACDADDDAAAACAARAKLFAGAAAVRAASSSLQIHGGVGYTREFPVERYLRNARQLDALQGGGAGQRATVAARITRRFAP
jgi:alkylation response protein AidB-like acyl-CoA dehydrogenase